MDIMCFKCAQKPIESAIGLSEPDVNQSHRIWGYVPIARDGLERLENGKGFGRIGSTSKQIASQGKRLAVSAAEPACLGKGFERAAVLLQFHIGLGELEVSDPKLRIDNDGLTCISNCPVSISRGKVDLGSESAIHRTEGI